MFEHFYNEIFRSVIIAFGSLFNGIEIHKKDANDDTYTKISKFLLLMDPLRSFWQDLSSKKI